MIESITISQVATYSTPEVLGGLSVFNYVFGTNGSGKTSISRVIADEAGFPACVINWKGGTRLQPMVYNCDFVQRNFAQSPELKGVFTLGEQQIETLTKIELTKGARDELTRKIEQLNFTLSGEGGRGGKRAELTDLESGLREKIWAQKLKLDGRSAQHALKGVMNSKDKFRDRFFAERTSNNAQLASFEELETQAVSVFGSSPTVEPRISRVEAQKLVECESSAVLRKRVIGKEDVDIAGLIEALGNSDWVSEGVSFYSRSNKVCPFCQQATSAAFASSLAAYFDETFLADMKAIDDLVSAYAEGARHVRERISAISSSTPRYLDTEKFEAATKLFDAAVSINTQRLAHKRREASQSVELEPIAETLASINELIEDADRQIAAHNAMVSDIETERIRLSEKIWKFILEEMKSELLTFEQKKRGLDLAISSLEQQIRIATEDRNSKESELRGLEKLTTSVQPTVGAINSLLASFGFRGFKLDLSDVANSYKLVRSDGSDAKATLSEGEKTFVSFLYVYHLLKGSESDSGMMTNRIVVFDDPVSSLDSDILFIVSSLIKKLCDDVRERIGQVKQVFVLTHNVYFHKEVTYNSKRYNVAMNEETFWIVRRPAQASRLEKQLTNPIRTSYELLWAEVRSPSRSNLTIQNTLRRILESYFKILGGKDLEDLCAMFEGREKVVCKSLCSWMHDGSHNAHDDLYVAVDESTAESYLAVFRAIFRKAQQIDHYKMMMGDAFVEDPAESGAVNEQAATGQNTNEQRNPAVAS